MGLKVNFNNLGRLITFVIAIICILSFLNFWICQDFSFLNRIVEISTNKFATNKLNDKIMDGSPIFITTACQGYPERMNGQIETDRIVNQTIVLIKSAAVLTTSYVNLIITVDRDYVFDRIVEEVENWPHEILSKFSLQKRIVWFPTGSNFRSLYAECASARLFFAEHMPDIDTAIFLDSDMIFMRPPEELWGEFQNFNSKQMCGMVEIEFYNPSIKTPYYGKTGLNSGLWMMNMTRMRNLPGGFEKTILIIYETYKPYIYYIDQDIANIFFNKTPEYLYDVGCEWNFRSRYCAHGIGVCEKSKSNGVHLLHGTPRSFFQNEAKIMIIYSVWKNFEPGQPLSELLNRMKKGLQEWDGVTTGYCNNVQNIDEIFVKGLEDHIKEKVL